MAIKNGDFIKLEFTGKIKETGEVFDTTNEERAKEAGIFVPNKTYNPIPIVVGGEQLIKALDEAIVGMEEGESKTIEVSPEKGFGERDTSKIETIPMKEFKKEGVNPYVGMELNLNGDDGRILTISGGRVRVDFNHKLAGKNLEYAVVINQIIIDDEEKIKSLIELHYPYNNLDIDKTELRIDGNKLGIKLDNLTQFDNKPYIEITLARFRICRDIWDNFDFENVEFIDTFEKREEEEEEDLRRFHIADGIMDSRDHSLKKTPGCLMNS